MLSCNEVRLVAITNKIIAIYAILWTSLFGFQVVVEPNYSHICVAYALIGKKFHKDIKTW